MSALVGLLVLLLIIGVAVWIVDMMPIPPPFKLWARIILGVLALLWLLRWTGFLSGRMGLGP